MSEEIFMKLSEVFGTFLLNVPTFTPEEEKLILSGSKEQIMKKFIRKCCVNQNLDPEIKLKWKHYFKKEFSAIYPYFKNMYFFASHFDDPAEVDAKMNENFVVAIENFGSVNMMG